MSVEFFNTKMGRQFFDGTLPRIAKALERIADRLDADASPICIGCDRPMVSEEDIGSAEATGVCAPCYRSEGGA